MIATEPGLGVRPANEYRYLVIGSPAGAYFKGGIKPVSVWLSHEYVRASPGGTGAAKFGGNYAASLLAQAQAADNGCDQVVWLDALERRYVEEMGGMNLFFVFGSGGSARLVTLELSGSLLPGITRDSLLQLAYRRRLRCRRTQDRRRRMAEEGRCGRDHRGVRLRHGRGDHAGLTREVRGRGVHHRRRATGRDHHGPARHPDRDPAGHLRRHARLDGPAELADRQTERRHRRRDLHGRTQHVAGDAAEPAHAVGHQQSANNPARPTPRPGPATSAGPPMRPARRRR